MTCPSVTAGVGGATSYRVSVICGVETGELPSSDAWVGVKVVRVLEAADKSLRNGGLGVEIV